MSALKSEVSFCLTVVIEALVCIRSECIYFKNMVRSVFSVRSASVHYKLRAYYAKVSNVKVVALKHCKATRYLDASKVTFSSLILFRRWCVHLLILKSSGSIKIFELKSGVTLATQDIGPTFIDIGRYGPDRRTKWN